MHFNFIFSKMADEKLSFDTALALAQKEGFAEPDPTFDISGQDAAQKTSILATLSFFKTPQWKKFILKESIKFLLMT